jgi:predicted ATPase
VTGEAGIGKTTLVEAFVASLSAKRPVWVGRGQCIEHYGAGEAYLPVLAALGGLCREPEGERLIEVLSQHALTWLVQMPALLGGAELDALQRKTAGATRARMLRELTEAVGALTAERPLVLWVEDLQWSDVSTLDWLAFVARRQEYARLLVIGTFRPVEVIVSAHPLKAVKQELQLHGQCEEMALGLLTEAQVAEYLAVRGLAGGRGQWKSQAEAAPLRNLARLLHRRTDGNPLFLVNVVEYLVAQGVLVQAEGTWVVHGGVEEIADRVPESLRQMIETQIARLSSAERQMLEVASVAGAEFSAAAVAAGRGTGEEEVEERCAALVRCERFLRSSGTGAWPDGTVTARYSFLHTLYQEVLYERVPVGRRARLHRRIGEREEAAYGERAREIAVELAVHFEQGREYRRAVQYLKQAGENASRRFAYQEATNLLTKGLELLKTLPDTVERTQQELAIQLTLGGSLSVASAFAG